MKIILDKQQTEEIIIKLSAKIKECKHPLFLIQIKYCTCMYFELSDTTWLEQCGFGLQSSEPQILSPNESLSMFSMSNGRILVSGDSLSDTDLLEVESVSELLGACYEHSSTAISQKIDSLGLCPSDDRTSLGHVGAFLVIVSSSIPNSLQKFRSMSSPSG